MNVKKMITCLLATLGLTTACGQHNYENADVKRFSELAGNPGVVLLDVRTAEEFAEGHIEGALNIDQKQNDFTALVGKAIPTDKTLAIYCRSGRRSANAAEKLAAMGYKCVNLLGGIIAWKDAGKQVTTDTHEVDVVKTKSGKTVKLHALVHSSIRIEYEGKEIEIDPVTKLGNRTIDYAAMPKADYIFVTHEHQDHFDKAALAVLSDGETKLVTNQRCAEMLGYGQVMANGDALKLADDITVEAIPAYNTTEGHLQFHSKGRDNGYIITIDGLRIYVAGDTEDIPEMATLKDIDIAFLPCNQPFTMTPDQLLRAAKTIKPGILFPYHYGQTDVSQIPSQLKEFGIDVRIRHYE